MERKALFIPFALLALVVSGCTRDVWTQEVEGLIVSLSTEPNPPRAGETVFKARLADKQGRPVTDAKVQFSSFMPYEKVPTEPEQYVKAVEGELRGEAYQATIHFTKPGRWKVSLKISRPKIPFILATFTLDVSA